MSSRLFAPIQLRDLALKNRVVISPLCQYSAVDGVASAWHKQHIGSFAISGAGLTILEATGVCPAGRISPQCLGLYDDATEAALTAILRDVRSYSDQPIGVQLAHAGRKAATRPTWDLAKGPFIPDAEGGWEPEGPSAQAYAEGWRTPRALDDSGLRRVRDDFVAATRRADRCGFDMIEIHAAHGYLLHEFCSPLTNHRNDRYGGPLENRLRFPLEAAQAMRDAFPRHKPMGMRVTGEDWIEGGLTLDDCVKFVAALAEIGIDYVTPSAGNIAPGVRLPKVGPGYMAYFGERLKRETRMNVMTVGMIYEPRFAEEIVASGRADMIAIGRAIMDNPRWPLHAATALGERIAPPKQYARSSVQHWPGYAALHEVQLREGEGAMGHVRRE